MLKKELKPKFLSNLLRLGSNNDGGYLVEKNSLQNSTILLSFGLGYNWSFEKDFYKNRKIPIVCYDSTVTYSSIKKYSIKHLGSFFFRIFKYKYFSKKGFFSEMLNKILLFKDYRDFFKGDIRHIKKDIALGKDSLYLKDIIKELNSEEKIFLKIDIEGAEYRLLNEIINFQDKISGLIIEFHNLDLNIDNVYSFIDKLNLKLVHIHPQNPAPVINNIPTQIELTFAKNPQKISDELSLPHKLDQPSNSNIRDITLVFE